MLTENNKHMESGTTHLLGMLRERITKMTEDGKWQEAISSSATLVEKARGSLAGGDIESLVQLAEALETRGDVLRMSGYLEEARLTYIEALELLNGRVEFTEQLARISASLGVLYDTVESDQEAITFYHRSIELYERLGAEHQGSIADICNNLGFIYRALGHYDEGEKLFLKALEISNTVYGSEHERTATVCNNVGALYLATGNDESAREMLSLGLETREEVLGKNHPDTGQSHSNLALCMVQMGNKKAAKEHFVKAVQIFESHIKTEGHEYSAVIENYVEFLRQSGEENLAYNILKKSQKRLKKIGLIR